MKERGILFSAPMVRALLAGTKTQTRRAMRVQQTLGRPEYPGRRDKSGFSTVHWLDTPEGIAGAIAACPYGQPGSKLWIRETHMDLGACFLYRANDGAEAERSLVAPGQRWRPSIHMPRIASRITLELTGVRVERLQDISEADALAEGVRSKHTADCHYSARESYSVLWETINGPGSWDANPWVWVLTFRRVA